jgi:hypothetical protein
MDWFERLTGFVELDYVFPRSKLKVNGGKLVPLVNGMSYRTGNLELASLSDLRNQIGAAHPISGRSRVSLVSGDAHSHTGVSIRPGT